MPWSGFIILSAWTNQPGSCDGALGAIFSVAAVPKAKCLSIVLPLASAELVSVLTVGAAKPWGGHKYQSASTGDSTSTWKWVDLLSDRHLRAYVAKVTIQQPANCLFIKAE